MVPSMETPSPASATEMVIEDLKFDAAAGDRIVLTYPCPLSPHAVDNLRLMWERWLAGPAERPLVLEGGVRISILRPLAPASTLTDEARDRLRAAFEASYRPISSPAS
jgi:hypothetical protein